MSPVRRAVKVIRGRVDLAPKPAWFPDWSGQTCAIIAGGGSVKRHEVPLLRGKVRVIVVNNAYLLAPWADALYVADKIWWNEYPAAKDFAGIKVTPHESIAKNFGCKKVEVLSCTEHDAHSLVFARLGTVAHGGNSGHQALNLAVQFGAKKLLLLGYDFCGDHWHGDHQQPLKNPRQAAMDKWAERLDALAPLLSRIGVEVINCSKASKLKNYPKRELRSVLC